jgi:hypothetical protein
MNCLHNSQFIIHNHPAIWHYAMYADEKKVIK